MRKQSGEEMQPSDVSGLPVLVVDDEVSALTSCQRTLRSGGIDEIICCQDSRKVMEMLSIRGFGAVLLDLSMPHVSGQELLPKITQEYPDIPVIIITGFNEVGTAVECMKKGAFDYMVKPVEKSRMVSGVKRALDLRELQNECSQLKERLVSDRLEHPEAFSEIVTNNATMRSIFQYVETVAKTSKPVLITGETGTGKELVAKAIHTISGLKGPFMDVNVAGVDDNAFSDTLFGHARGAFTGADEPRSGLIEQASGGILFLDEIGDLSMPSQIKLLRLVQEHKYLPLGSDVAKRSDVRFIFTTNRDLANLLDAGQFRKDLYYRLSTHHVHILPLRRRLDDLPLLVDHFLEKASKALKRDKPTPPRELLTLLGTYHFPGNVRELEAMIFDAVSTHTSRMLSMDVFKFCISKTSPPVNTDPISPEQQGQRKPPFILADDFPSLSEATHFLIGEALNRADGNLSIAAHLLGISRQALSKRLKRAED
jgi:DNA-binding NtrC family response regulator